MADDENETKPTSEKPESKEATSDSEKIEEKETKAPDSEEEMEKEEKSPKKEDKSLKTEEKSPKKEEKITKEEKSPPKKKTAEKKDDEDDDDDDESEDGDAEELRPGLLEMPLEVEGKREKKKVERLSAAMIRTPVEKKKIEIEEGSGTKLGDIPYVEHQLLVTKAIDLKPLHRVLFLKVGTNNEVKKNIRQFCGFSGGKDSKEHEKRMVILNKMVLAELKAICLLLGLERGGTKVNLVERVMEYLMKPEDKGLSAKANLKKKSKSAGGKKKGTKRKRKSKASAKKGKGNKDENSLVDDSDDDEEEKEEEEAEEEEEEEEDDEPEEESEDEAPKKKKAKVENKKKATPPKKSAKENGKKEKPAKKESPKKSPAKKKPDPELSDSLSDDSEDEPIAKMIKSPPSNDEIKDLVKKILDGADLETVTMKTVVKQVYAKYPSFDLSDRKDFIKDTVREVIS